ncbi:hypothetical protein [Bradyrhizobium japonicum]|uniref:hypothetical protein n=1 Tax=Bradyrhizobium japonicum TaxID=375 RepID=UPI00058055CE|nr:hypothetical protein [Bradyrhizobium japonicum]MCD9109963.1 hypothetical protein [Bradyrhizobium japonicum]MCD9259572.1 hypothetical protein [Bradyrhizobium japonicum SEMIA 5079]MCD9910424.1 hypothetical protein [Bradyrhizobium japonicum]MCS3977547.1 hypothetical protein [Bradyrhizobium japonicum]WRI75727.1 hypothetical protein RZE83_22045 [Bradyrhizobium japonicum]
MSSAKRRINSTGRKRIPQDKIDLRILTTVHGEPLKAKLAIDLDALGLPPTAALSVEAYHRSSAMRFDCGTVGSKRIPEVLTLNEIDQSGGVLFRIKVIDQESDKGKILASADRVRPSVDGEHIGRRSIFPVEYRDLGQEIWRVEIDDDAGPSMLLNSKVPGLMTRIHDNPLVAGALLPAAFRIVLLYLAYNPAEEDEGDGTGWKAEWKRFCVEGLNLEDDPDDLEDDEARDAWVDQAVSKYCESRAFVEKSKQLVLEQTHG